MRSFFVAALWMLLAWPASAEMTWFEATDRLQLEKGAAVNCAKVLLRHLPDEDPAALTRAEFVYEEARTDIMSVIASLEVALIQDQEEAALSGLKERLARGSALREAFCAYALFQVPPTEGEKSVLEALVSLVGDLVDAGVTIWKEIRSADETRRNNLRTALEDAKWPAFSDINA